MTNKQLIKNQTKTLRRARVRSRISGTEVRPRLAVFRSNSAISVQLIDDTNGKTLASASSASIKSKATKTEKALEVGKLIAQSAMAKNITEVVFDRGGNKYHGRVKALADSAREAGLKF